jgi:hypothetical protein
LRSISFIALCQHGKNPLTKPIAGAQFVTQHSHTDHRRPRPNRTHHSPFVADDSVTLTVAQFLADNAGGVLVPEYLVDGTFWVKNHYPGGYIFRDKLNLEAIPPKTANDSWQLRYGFDSPTPNRATKLISGTVAGERLEFQIPIMQKNRPGIDAPLVLSAASWNAPPMTA